METKIQWRDLQIHVNLDARIAVSESAPGRAQVHIEWDAMSEKKPAAEIAWQMPMADIQHTWHPGCGKNRGMGVDWADGKISRLASSAPAFVFFNEQGRSRMAVALSDVLTEICILAGVREEDGMLIFRVSIPLDATGLTHEYDVTLYRDGADVSFAEALRRLSRWWTEDCGLAPMTVPEAARLPMYSTWYSFHQATIAEDLEAECARAAQLGMKTVIVDDGWQTSDGNRGYGYCGDWRPTPDKIPDMRAHVEKIHQLGMKYMLWYSVPFIGEWSENWKRFEHKLSARNERLHCGVLDPRYPDARAFLIDTYANALKQWDQDGFKLDFIDAFPPSSRAPMPAEGMDYVKMEDAILRLMTDVMQALRAIKPDILIEFRQSYIGPAMRTFGNMFRVADCPYDPLTNRVGVVDLRLMSGDTAVHSDMLMWHADEPVEVAARQLLNVLFGVPQISVRLDKVSEEHRRMLAFWTAFFAEHRALLAAPMEVESPELLYPLVRTRLGDEEAIAVYAAHHAATLSDAKVTWLFNVADDTEVVLRNSDRPGSAAIFDCTGVQTAQMDLPAAQLQAIEVPVGGFAHIVR